MVDLSDLGIDSYVFKQAAVDFADFIALKQRNIPCQVHIPLISSFGRIGLVKL